MYSRNSLGVKMRDPLNLLNGKCLVFPVIINSAPLCKAHSKNLLSAGSSLIASTDIWGSTQRASIFICDKSFLTLFWSIRLNLGRASTFWYSLKISSLRHSLISFLAISDTTRAGLLPERNKAETITLVSTTIFNIRPNYFLAFWRTDEISALISLSVILSNPASLALNCILAIISGCLIIFCR